ncbi:quinolinate synthase NadA [Methanogenium sp. MK-MG]|uniref:quinolinate synthase NadA n=1 Tax=Methanogenium sp. MK-MG TaxID=2599926 RepID=UPI0013EAAF5B|nr:quinolinate synthase NadA [Methanogenium sp. MK-MG]KAF1075397.1 Quinolinate synthase A [Methanogenium sp. MK-MG]
MNTNQLKRIDQLKKEKNAIILAHNYEPPEIQDAADIIGDSLELAVKARSVTEDTIILCGVRFMAETAKVLNPTKTIILPAPDAGCPLADYLTPDMVREARKAHPGAAVVLYVNSDTAAKAEADIVCTSANAVEVVRSLEETTILFGPDSNLADYVASRVPEKQIIPLPKGGHCYVHAVFTCDDVITAAEDGFTTICHPECPREVRKGADVVASTGGMVRMAKNADSWMILTEKGIAYRLEKLFPDKEFRVREDAVCVDMKKITLDMLEHSLITGEYAVELPADLMDRARGPIERMMALKRE